MFETWYIRRQEKQKTRDLARLLRIQGLAVANALETLDTKAFSWEKKGIVENALQLVLPIIPEYLLEVLPSIIKRGAKPTIDKYSKLLPEDYNITFNLPTSPASDYLRRNHELHLSDRQGSISKGTKDMVSALIASGIDEGKSYGEIANDIREGVAYPFSRARAKLIAVNEVWRAYGFGNMEPNKELAREWYVLVKKWNTSHDAKVRQSHIENWKQGWIPLEDNFLNGDEYAPSVRDINCRCTMESRIIDKPLTQ